ncbi:peptidyl-prolyl cis-trans isomerase [gamma proteobacterium HTCC5015]|nr:peptidyl-prolyl cis-trans isomerase [gamma proteobacterium HTCC5015]
MKSTARLVATAAALLTLTHFAYADEAASSAQQNEKVLIETNRGHIEVLLNAEKAPESVANFLAYVDEGFYEGTLFHRTIPAFMIQGGGFDTHMAKKPTKSAIINEADNGLKNLKGTIAMARTGYPHSATSQFFINTKDNPFLDHTGKNPRGWGYAVFGKVTRGMDTVRAIELSTTKVAGQHKNLPVEPIVIQSITRIDSPQPKTKTKEVQP